ncbi:MAG: hypothetical protein ACT4P3_11160 [Betaproteobacteria bacterium]
MPFQRAQALPNVAHLGLEYRKPVKDLAEAVARLLAECALLGAHLLQDLQDKVGCH